MTRRLAVIGVGNMAKAIINGIISSNLEVSQINLYDKNEECYKPFLKNKTFYIADSIAEAVKDADCVLLAVKPQNYFEVLEIISGVPCHSEKIYISIGAGITVDSVSKALNGAKVVRVLPNLPMTIGKGLSAICRSQQISKTDFDFVESLFSVAGSTILIDENEMNRIIGVTSSSPAYVFKFIDAIFKGAKSQGLELEDKALIDAICDVVIGAAELLKGSTVSPSELIAKVASKGGTTEQALLKLDEFDFDNILKDAMVACTRRAEKLGENN